MSADNAKPYAIPSRVQIDATSLTYESYNDPAVRWNGFVMPYFGFIEACHVCASLELAGAIDYWKYDPANDAIVINPDDDETRESYAGLAIQTPNGPQWVYPIGAGYWTWSLAEE